MLESRININVDALVPQQQNDDILLMSRYMI